MSGLFFVLYSFKKFDRKTEYDSDDGCECHTAERDRAEGDAGIADTDTEYDGGQNKVDGLIVINFRFDKHTDTACRNDAEEQERYAAHNRCRDTLDSSGKFADEREDDSEGRGTADDPYAEYLGNGENADVFAVCRIRCRAEEAGEHRRDTIAEEGAVKTGVFCQVFVYDIARYDQVTDMLNDNNECGG